ncbi:Formimidoyltetrahydrofolate cyclodeaminase [Anaerocolumna jejuensis DSM 15929]|uniref:Formimidoyltetrahydrofolate cyclodeaminase n=1 Tax=Anaerocolumna jejuensis DSM 15929 TaxID=1121322 RepID=A0A1M6NMH3_9FIRM|nr:cyclodeaminase/cyclohydrolase family protein [Anaerocolumna jejuensis]SHJ96893.1 Formimidoyltetrahydrofolate cyclodeaminase [Anaerocolumna jejuensis DSM 15929]
MKNTINGFLDELSSQAPTPGGGGASALIGAVSAALCSMVANLTSGKKKYAEYQDDIDKVIEKTKISIGKLLHLIEKDGQVFAPLAEAYRIPKDQPDRDKILEEALIGACSVPLDIIREVSGIVGIIEELQSKGSRMALSDVGVAASACRSALEGAAMNVYINTKLMKDREYAAKINAETTSLLEQSCSRCEKVYLEILNELRCV